MRLGRLVGAMLVAVAGTIAFGVAAPSGNVPVAAAATCTPSVGPGIPPPASVPSGIPGFHAAWYGQSGYPVLCPGQISRAVVAYYNSGSIGWYSGLGTAAFLGTWSPEPGQDQASLIGGDGTHGSPNTRWPGYNRPATVPVNGRYGAYVGPSQVAWFQFTVKAPPTPGTYRLYIRPLIEGVQWMEDIGVYWQVTVLAGGDPPQRVTVESVDLTADTFTAGGVTYRFDPNDQFDYGDWLISYDQFKTILSAGDIVDVNYEPVPSAMSRFNIFAHVGYAPPRVTWRVGNYDGPGVTIKNDVRIDFAEPASQRGQFYAVERAPVAPGTTTCTVTSGPYANPARHSLGGGSVAQPFIDYDVPSGTHCYRAGAHTQAASATAFAYSTPLTMPSPPELVSRQPTSVFARVVSSSTGSPSVFDDGDLIKIAFDEAMRSPCPAAASIRLRDADGTVADIVNAGGQCATATTAETLGRVTYQPAYVLVITVRGTPSAITPGSIPGLQLPATVIAQTGITDEDGYPWDLAGSTDLVLGDPN
jgi:hypothetical protein